MSSSKRHVHEAFYQKDFDRITADIDNFGLHPVLSDPLPEDDWTGDTGFINQVVLDTYVKNYPAPGTLNTICVDRR